MDPNDAHVLIPGAWGYGPLHGKGALQIVQPLKWRDYSGLSRWTQPNHMRPYKWSTLPGWAGERDVTTGEASETCTLAGSEDGGRGCQPRNADLWKL